MSDQKKEKIFADGFLFKRNENAPPFVIGSLSMKEEEAVAFIRQRSKNGWVNVDIKISTKGKYYIELDNYDPAKKTNVIKEEAKPIPVKVKKAEVVIEPEEELPF